MTRIRRLLRTPEHRGLYEGINSYFDQTKPFLTRKTDMQACSRAINVCLQTAKALTTLSAPFLPFTAEKCAKMLNLEEGYKLWSAATEALPAGHPFCEPTILVKKLDAKEIFSE